MSFTDGKPRVATAEEVAAKWNGRPVGRGFRCRLCGHHFAVGDVWRFVFANSAASKSRYGNFFVCATCDGSDVIDRACAQEAEFVALSKTRFWYFTEMETE